MDAKHQDHHTADPSTPSDTRQSPRVALRELELCAQGRVGKIPLELFVRHAARIASEADGDLGRETMQALLRRIEFMERDRLRVAQTPENGALYGEYRTRRERSAARAKNSVCVFENGARGAPLATRES